MDNDNAWQKQLLIGAAVLLAVSVLIGGIVAVAALKAADVAGIDGDADTSSPAGPPRMSEENPDSESEPTTGSTPPSTTTPTSPTQPTETTKEPREPKPAIQLVASPRSASTYERINLTGSYRGNNGASLQVQRKEFGSWVDFPTSASVSGGTFSTYVETGRSGANMFRMIDESTGRTSNVVVVSVS